MPAPSTVLVNADFLPLIEKLADKLPSVRKYVLLNDARSSRPPGCRSCANTRTCWKPSSPFFQFPDFDENTRATTFHTTGTTGRPKGVYFSHRQLVLHSLAGLAEYGCAPSQGRIHRDDVYMPMTPMFHVHAWGCPYYVDPVGAKQVLSRALCARCPPWFDRAGGRDVHALRADDPADAALRRRGAKDVDLSKLKMVVGGSALPRSLARAAMARGIDVFTGYGQSESCPMLAGHHLTTKQLAGRSRERQMERRASAGLPGPTGRSAHRRCGHVGRAA